MGQNTLAELAAETARIYAVGCDVGCKLICKTGRLLASYGEEKRNALCQILSDDIGESEQCRKSYLYGGYQAEKLGEYYIYFCPTGLVNWAVPLLSQGVAEYYLVGGPVLLHEIDDLLLNDIYRQTPQLKPEENTVYSALAQIPVVDPTRVRYLAEMLWRIAQNLMKNELRVLAERKDFVALGAGIAEAIHDQKSAANTNEGYVFTLERDLIFSVQTGDQKDARKILNEILGVLYFESTSFKVKKSRLIALTAVLARAAIEAGADLEVIFGLENSYITQIQDETDILEISRLLVPVLERFIACTFELKKVKNRDLIHKATSFIRHNYRSETTLQDVAKHVGLAPTYFGKLFSEEMEMAYTEYLNRVRIEAAKLLMKDDLPLAEVSHRVGFNDQSYFSKVFKRLEGQSPLKWRTDHYV